MTTTVIIPTYNEDESRLWGTLVDVNYYLGDEDEIIVVDDGSVFFPKRIVESNLCKIIRNDKNMGKGYSVRRGIEEAKGDIIVIQDADEEYRAKDLEDLLKPILMGDADVVYGSRFLGGTHRGLYFWHSVGNRILTLMCNMLSNLNLSDIETGYKAFRTEVLRTIPLRSNRFGFEPEVTMKMARRQCRIYETPISYAGRKYSDGKKTRWTDGLVALWCIVRYRIAD